MPKVTRNIVESINIGTATLVVSAVLALVPEGVTVTTWFGRSNSRGPWIVCSAAGLPISSLAGTAFMYSSLPHSRYGENEMYIRLNNSSQNKNHAGPVLGQYTHFPEMIIARGDTTKKTKRARQEHLICFFVSPLVSNVFPCPGLS